MVFGPGLVETSGRGGREEDLLFTKDTLLSGKFAQQRKLRMRAQVVALEGVANSKVRRKLTDVAIGDVASPTPSAQQVFQPRGFRDRGFSAFL